VSRTRSALDLARLGDRRDTGSQAAGETGQDISTGVAAASLAAKISGWSAFEDERRLVLLLGA
jgi:hypothetical protein